MPSFLETEITEPSYKPTSAWVEHGAFAMWLVRKIRPNKIVELGTHWGYSYFAMCEAVLDCGLDTQCIAVDTWAGDVHAREYGEEVFEAVSVENSKYLNFSTLLRKTFEEALADVENGSVDLLHVDGRHFYEDVKYDFETWIPKLSDRAVVLFHDTMVRERGFGVFKYWAEISKRYPSFNFTHGHGLGVIFVGENISPQIRELIDLSGSKNGPRIVEDFFEIAGGITSERIQEQAHRNSLESELSFVNSLVSRKDVEQLALVQSLESEIVRLRRKPLKQAKRLLQYRTLKFLSKAQPLVTKKAALRFSKSAAKRNPSNLSAFRKAIDNTPKIESHAEKNGIDLDGAKLSIWALPKSADEVALFVTHSPDGFVKPHARLMVDALQKLGISVTLIIATDMPIREDLQWTNGFLNGVYIRENKGYDFAAWFHVLQDCPELMDAQTLILTNDSYFGPTSDQALSEMIDRIRASKSDVVGATDSYEKGWHIQSYFLAIKRGFLRSHAFQNFARQVKNLATKTEVIDAYEVTFAQYAKDHGFEVEVLFKSNDTLNPTLFHWKKLLLSNYPFVKVMAIRDKIPGVAQQDWQREVAKAGLDPKIISDFLSRYSLEHMNISDNVTRSVDSLKVLLIGPWNFSNGLGVASRGYLQSLLKVNCRLNFEPIRNPFGSHKRSAPTQAMTSFVGPADIVIVHLNPDAWQGLLTEKQRDMISSAKYKIGAYVWEADKLPKSFEDGLSSVDEVWAPSQFCAQAFEAASDAKVRVIPYCVPIPKDLVDTSRSVDLRKRFGIPLDTNIILYSLDASSYLKRKNPQQLIEAYNDANLINSKWTLLLKAKHLQDSGIEGEAILKLANRVPGVVVVDEPLSRAEYSDLVSLAKIYASPHSSEGFGLTIAEAMARGQIVIATDFGGSVDFLDQSSGFPVASHSFKLPNDIGPYSKGTIWAKPNQGDLIEKLRIATSLETEDVERITDAAIRKISEQLSSEVISKKMSEAFEDALANKRIAI